MPDTPSRQPFARNDGHTRLDNAILISGIEMTATPVESAFEIFSKRGLDTGTVFLPERESENRASNDVILRHRFRHEEETIG